MLIWLWAISWSSDEYVHWCIDITSVLKYVWCYFVDTVWCCYNAVHFFPNTHKRHPMHSSPLMPRSHCADLEVLISTTWKIVENGMVGSWSSGNNLEVCLVGKRSAVIRKSVRQSFSVKLCRIGHHCGYNLFMDRFQSYVESETLWDSYPT